MRKTRAVTRTLALGCLAMLTLGPAGPRALAQDQAGKRPGLDEYGKRIFNEAYGKLSDILVRTDRHKDLPDSAWLSEDKQSNRRKIRALVEEALAILELSKITECARKHEALKVKIRAAYDEIAEYQRKKITAPTESSWFFGARTKKEIQALIDAKKDAACKEQPRKLVQAMRDEFKAAGLTITAEQVNFFLASVAGDGALQLNAVFHNIKQINLQLAQLVQESDEDAETAKKYYGLHVILIQILIDGHRTFVNSIENDYLPRVADLLKANAANHRETRELIRRTEDGQSLRILEANLRAQAITDRAGWLYQEHLKRLKNKLEKSVRSLQQKHLVARNTYNTAKIASELVKLIKASEKELTALQGLELPELIPFENVELQRKFEQITQQLKSASQD